MGEAIGFEERIKRDREARQAKPAYQDAIVVGGKSGSEMSRGLGALVDPAMALFSLPERAGFDQLYREANFTNMVSSRVNDNILTVMTPTYNISLNVRTVLEILAKQMNIPMSLPSELHIKSPPPFISDIKGITNWWISQMLCEYQKIFRLNDPLIQKMCNEYFLSLSYPIMVRLAYTEWENQQMDWKVGLKVKDIAADYATKNHDLKIDYDKQLDDKTTVIKTEMNKLQMENKELWTKIDIMNERLANLKLDKDNQSGAVEEYHTKYKNEQARVQQLEKEIIKLKNDIKLLEAQAEKDDESESWKKDLTSTAEIPVYRNKISGEVLVFPVSMEQFKKEYKLTKQEGNNCIYQKDDGTTFNLPDVLVDELVDTNIDPMVGKKKMGKEAIKLLQNNPKWKEIHEFIKSIGGEASTGEIATGTNNDRTNIRKQYLKPMEDNGFIIGEQVGKEWRYSLPS